MKIPPTKVKKNQALILANFGGPRDMHEIRSFLTELLCDQEVVRTPLPSIIHRFLFSKIAKKRTQKIAADYQSIGGKSPIYEDTEKVADALRKQLTLPVITFHRYLPKTHSSFLKEIKKMNVEEFLVFPMFPQFSYSTTGSIAKWFHQKVNKNLLPKFSWLKSYAAQPSYIELYQKRIEEYIAFKKLDPKKLILIFSAHGLPAKFVAEGDPYQKECEQSFDALTRYFPKCQSLLCYQSKFGPGQWIKPYTIDVCLKIDQWAQKERKQVLFIPLAFTSDHIETLHEVESEYMPVVRNKGFSAYRLPAFNQGEDWVNTIKELIGSSNYLNNQELLRQKK